MPEAASGSEGLDGAHPMLIHPQKKNTHMNSQRMEAKVLSPNWKHISVDNLWKRRENTHRLRLILDRGQTRATMKYVFAVLFSLCTVLGWANENRISRSQYISQWKEVAIDNMVKHGIPASITLAQGILESGDGNSQLASKSNNHFGIKCHSDWQGKKVYHDDDAKGECFRKYDNARESFADHSVFLKKPRYAPLFELDITDYKAWAHGLKKAGYATNPKYAQLLIDIIEANDLTQYDLEGLARMTAGTPVVDAKSSRKNRANAKRDNNDGFGTLDLAASRSVELSRNRIKYTYGKEGDSFESIAEELDMMAWQIRKYNDFTRNHKIKAGEIIYLQPKRARSSEHSHTVQEGETLWDISQRHGVKMKNIVKRNGLTEGQEPSAGTVLRLR